MNEEAEKLRYRLNHAYRERAVAASLAARAALAAGWTAGVGKDDREDWDDEWRVVLYIDTPVGQVSWYIAPDDQQVLYGLPPYDGSWDGEFRGRETAWLSDLARPAPAEGAVREALKLIETQEGEKVRCSYCGDTHAFNHCRSGGAHSFQGTGETVYRLDTDDAKRLRDLLLSALSSPEDATPAAPVSVEEAAQVLWDAVQEAEETDPLTRTDYDRALISRDLRALRAISQQDSNTAEGDPQ